MALKKCQNMQGTVYLLCSHINTCKVGLINWTVQEIFRISELWWNRNYGIWTTMLCVTIIFFKVFWNIFFNTRCRILNTSFTPWWMSLRFCMLVLPDYPYLRHHLFTTGPEIIPEMIPWSNMYLKTGHDHLPLKLLNSSFIIILS